MPSLQIEQDTRSPYNLQSPRPDRQKRYHSSAYWGIIKRASKRGFNVKESKPLKTKMRRTDVETLDSQFSLPSANRQLRQDNKHPSKLQTLQDVPSSPSVSCESQSSAQNERTLISYQCDSKKHPKHVLDHSILGNGRDCWSKADKNDKTTAHKSLSKSVQAATRKTNTQISENNKSALRKLKQTLPSKVSSNKQNRNKIKTNGLPWQMKFVYFATTNKSTGNRIVILKVNEESPLSLANPAPNAKCLKGGGSEEIISSENILAKPKEEISSLPSHKKKTTIEKSTHDKEKLGSEVRAHKSRKTLINQVVGGTDSLTKPRQEREKTEKKNYHGQKLVGSKEKTHKSKKALTIPITGSIDSRKASLEEKEKRKMKRHREEKVFESKEKAHKSKDTLTNRFADRTDSLLKMSLEKKKYEEEKTVGSKEKMHKSKETLTNRFAGRTDSLLKMPLEKKKYEEEKIVGSKEKMHKSKETLTNQTANSSNSYIKSPQEKKKYEVKRLVGSKEKTHQSTLTIPITGSTDSLKTPLEENERKKKKKYEEEKLFGSAEKAHKSKETSTNRFADSTDSFINPQLEKKKYEKEKLVGSKEKTYKLKEILTNKFAGSTESLMTQPQERERIQKKNYIEGNRRSNKENIVSSPGEDSKQRPFSSRSLKTPPATPSTSQLLPEEKILEDENNIQDLCVICSLRKVFDPSIIVKLICKQFFDERPIKPCEGCKNEYAWLISFIDRPCKYISLGCSSSVQMDSDHEAECKFQPHVCTMCNEKMPKYMADGHFQNKHRLAWKSHNVKVSDFKKDPENNTLHAYFHSYRNQAVNLLMIKSEGMDAEFKVHSLDGIDVTVKLLFYKKKSVFNYECDNVSSTIGQTNHFLSFIKVPKEALDLWFKGECELDINIWSIHNRRKSTNNQIYEASHSPKKRKLSPEENV